MAEMSAGLANCFCGHPRLKPPLNPSAGQFAGLAAVAFCAKPTKLVNTMAVNAAPIPNAFSFIIGCNYIPLGFSAGHSGLPALSCTPMLTVNSIMNNVVRARRRSRRDLLVTGMGIGGSILRGPKWLHPAGSEPHPALWTASRCTGTASARSPPGQRQEQQLGPELFLGKN